MGSTLLLDGAQLDTQTQLTDDRYTTMHTTNPRDTMQRQPFVSASCFLVPGPSVARRYPMHARAYIPIEPFL